MLIITKEIKAIKKKNVKHTMSYYSEIEESILGELEEHFNLLNEFDMKDSIDSMVTLKCNLREYLQYRESSINPLYLKKIPLVDWDEAKGDPYFLLNFINIKKDEFGVSIVITSPFDVIPEMVHRNVYISFIIQYVYYFYPKEKIMEIFKGEKPDIDKLIVYYPLKKERKEYIFKDISGVFQDVELEKILNIFALKLFNLPLNTDCCKYCEQRKFCFHRTNSTSIRAINALLLNKKDKVKTIM